MSKLKVDLHYCFNNSKEINNVLNQAIEDAVSKKIKEVEIIHGKGSGQLKKRVLRFLETKKHLFSRIDKDSKNFGRLFVYFKH